MIRHSEISLADLHRAIRSQALCYGGNRKFKIYGLLSCKSGKRMQLENRVFFASEAEALRCGYRPCGHCMKLKYDSWKKAGKVTKK